VINLISSGNNHLLSFRLTLLDEEEELAESIRSSRVNRRKRNVIEEEEDVMSEIGIIESQDEAKQKGRSYDLYL
jgi:hypothetical protein